MALTKVTYSMIDGAFVNVLDYGAIGDGTADDTSAVQAAVDSGASSVFFPDGTYLINAVSLPSNIRLFGAATIKAKLGVSVPGGDLYSKKLFTASSQSNIMFDGLNFDGGIVGPIASTEFAATDPNSLESLLEISSCTELKIRGCTFNNFCAQATPTGTRNQRAKKGVIYVLACTDVEIFECEIGNNVFIEGFVILDSSDITVRNNYSYQDDDNRRLSTPVAVTGANTQNVLITDNTFIGHGGSGVNVWALKNVKIIGNSFVSARGVDFSNEGGYSVTQSPTNVMICNNTVDFTGASSYVSTSQQYGIVVLGDTNYPTRGVLVSGNHVTSVKYPLTIDRCTDVRIESNRVMNPWGNTAGAGLGIVSTDSSFVQIKNNFVNGEGTTEFGAGISCIYTQDSAYVEIVGNIMQDANTYLLYINEGNERVLVEDNVFKLNTTSPTRNIFGAANGADSLIIRNNEFPINTVAGGFPDNRVNFNCAFSSQNYFLFENETIIEMADDSVFLFPGPSANAFLETGANSIDIGSLFYKQASNLSSIYAATNVDFTTGVLSGTTGTDGKLNISAVSDTIYVENRLGASTFIRVKISA